MGGHPLDSLYCILCGHPFYGQPLDSLWTSCMDILARPLRTCFMDVPFRQPMGILRTSFMDILWASFYGHPLNLLARMARNVAACGLCRWQPQPLRPVVLRT